MANISEVNVPQGDTLRPTDRAADTAREAGQTINRFARETGAAIGNAVGQVGGQIGAAVDNHIAGQMIGHGSVVSSQLMANLTKQIDDTMSQADPNDVSAGQGQRDNVEKSIQAFQDQFSDAPEKVQNWALATSDHMRSHFGNSITAHEMSRASDAAELNMRNTVRANANTVSLDPASLDATVAKQKMDFDAYVATHTLPPGAIGALRKELAKADSALAMTSAKSIIEKNPAAWDKLKVDGGYDKYLDPEQKLRLDEYARTTATHMRQDQLRDEQEERRQKAQASEDRSADYLKQTYDPLSGRVLRPSAKLNLAIQNDPSMLQKDKNSLIRWNQTQYEAQRREDKASAEGNAVRDDPKVLDDARARVGAVDNALDRQEISDLLGAEKITSKTAHDLAWRVGQQDAAWQGVQRQFKPQFANIKETILRDPVAKFDETTGTRINQLEQDAQHKLRDLYNAHDKAGLQAALDPKSTSYVFANTAVKSPTALKDAADAVRAKEGPQVAGRIGGTPASSAPKSYKSEAEVKAAGLPDGTVVTINGKRFVWNN